MLARKYRNIRKAIEDDPLLFQDDIFNIEPQSGQIWPNSEMTITISFRPTQALSYSCVAHCNISCSEERLALHLNGEGIGPKAFLSATDCLLGDIYITESRDYDITIENRGEIEAAFELMPNDSPFGSLFEFGVQSGRLGVGERLNFRVTFTPDKLGEFDEIFKFRLQGSTEMLTLHFSGHVVAPKFKFSPEIINYDKVSLTFEYSNIITLENISTVEFSYTLRIPGDGRHGNKEFEIKPARDTLGRGDKREIEVLFTPYIVKNYDMVLVIDIDRVGHDMHSIPIKAESYVPTVKVESNELQFGEVFLRHRNERPIRLMNQSSLKAKFKIRPQAEEHKMLATYTTDRDGGEIEPDDNVTINVALITKKLGPIVLPLSIEVVGNTNVPQVVNILAQSKGPEVEVSEREIDFDKVEVLRDWTKSLIISNKSPIKADFHIFTKNKNSIFKPLIKQGELSQEESLSIPIVCNADDAQKFVDTLHIVIKEGVDKDIVLRARGYGSTIFCKEDLKYISFGTQYTFRNYTREIFVENKGRKLQKLMWQRKKPMESKKQREEAKEREKKAKEGKDVIEADPDGLDYAFTIVPETISLPPKTGIMFQFRANSIRKGKLPEQFQLTTQAANERKQTQLYNTTIEGEFINPTLVFSEPKIYFKYSWEKGEPFRTISKNLDVTCACQLPTNFLLKVQPPFSINSENFSLLPGKTSSVKVDFDPGLKYDRVSDKIKSKLQVIHVDHPHKEFVELIGEVCFPNLEFSRRTIDFGSILNDTSKRITIQITNISEMPLYYEWSFVDEEVVREKKIDDQDLLEDDPKNKKNAREGAERNVIPINEIFDILPMNGSLAPGESETVEFVFHAILGQKVRTMAVCSVDGGPEYEVQLTGDSSLIDFSLSTNVLDYGNAIPFNDWETREFIIENTGKVAYDFSINMDSLYRKGLVEISPLSDKIKGYEKIKVHVKLCPGIPDKIDEYFTINIAHFEPQRIQLTGNAIYPALMADLARSDSTDFIRALETEKINVSDQFLEHPLSTNRQNTGEITISDSELEADRKLFCDLTIKSMLEYQNQIIQEQQQQTESKNPERTPKEGRQTPKRSAQERRFESTQKDFQTIKADELYLTDEARLQGLSKFHMAKSNLYVRHLDPKIYEKVNLASYQCDFRQHRDGSPQK